MVEAALAPLHVKGGSPCEYPHRLEFGQQYQGRIVVIVKAVYGLKSSGAAWHNMLSSTLHDLGFKSSLADADVWMMPNVKLKGEYYYDYIFVYVDDLLVLSAFARDIMETIGKPIVSKMAVLAHQRHI
jgi:hypothetical protein